MGIFSFIFFFEFFGFSKYVFNVFFGEMIFVVGDDNLVGFVSVFFKGRDVYDFVGIKIEGNFNLGNIMGSGGNVSKFEFVE